MDLISSVRFVDNSMGERKPKQGKPGQKQIHAVVDEKDGVIDNQPSSENDTRIGSHVDVSV